MPQPLCESAAMRCGIRWISGPPHSDQRPSTNSFVVPPINLICTKEWQYIIVCGPWSMVTVVVRFCFLHGYSTCVQEKSKLASIIQTAQSCEWIIWLSPKWHHEFTHFFCICSLFIFPKYNCWPLLLLLRQQLIVEFLPSPHNFNKTEWWH